MKYMFQLHCMGHIYTFLQTFVTAAKWQFLCQTYKRSKILNLHTSQTFRNVLELGASNFPLILLRKCCMRKQSKKPPLICLQFLQLSDTLSLYSYTYLVQHLGLSMVASQLPMVFQKATLSSTKAGSLVIKENMHHETFFGCDQ